MFDEQVPADVVTSADRTPAAVVAEVEVEDLAGRAGTMSLSDQHRLALSHDAPDRHVAVVRDGTTASGALLAFAQLVPGAEAASLEVLIDQRSDPATVIGTLIPPLLDLATTTVHWWWSSPADADTAIVRGLGATAERHLLQMRRPLPTGLEVSVDTRAFRPGEDEAAWVEVNNRAFAAHPEQGRWSVSDVEQREDEPWFDPDGFRLHERDGQLAAFCWTKLHDGDPVLGEIYVIGVDPEFQGLGLGRQLTVAGLDSIARRGVTHGMLYVDEDNVAAVGLYRALGFTVHHTDVAFIFEPPIAAS
ncbi:MAG: mycothiol synthase [Desertimonas sp.]